MASKDPALRDTIIRNARAAERERLRNLARQQLAENGLVNATDQMVDDLADELERAKLSAAGRKGARRTRARLAQARRYEALHAALVEQTECLLDLLREAAPVDPDDCDHTWPDEITDSTPCDICALPYSEWSEIDGPGTSVIQEVLDSDTRLIAERVTA